MNIHISHIRGNPTDSESVSGRCRQSGITMHCSPALGSRIAIGVVCAMLLLTACGTGTQDAEIASAKSRAAEMAASIDATPLPTTKPSPSPVESEEPSPSKVVEPDSEQEPSSTPTPSQPGINRWASYPWGSNGFECPSPSEFPGATHDPLDPDVVVLLGDSLLRDARAEILTSLQARGFQPVFVCWGGKNLEWGLQQVSHMRSQGLMPRCLVINLGTNDLKGTTAQGLADAVDPETVEARLISLLGSVADIDHVFTVDIAAEPSAAPSTMDNIGELPARWLAAVRTVGVGSVIPWSSYSTPGSGLTNTVPGDGVHDTTRGVATRASLITAAVSTTCG